MPSPRFASSEGGNRDRAVDLEGTQERGQILIATHFDPVILGNGDDLRGNGATPLGRDLRQIRATGIVAECDRNVRILHARSIRVHVQAGSSVTGSSARNIVLVLTGR